MNTYKSKSQENQSQTAAVRSATGTAQAKWHAIAGNSPQVQQLKSYQQMADQAVQRKGILQRMGNPEEEELLQGKFETLQRMGNPEEELLQGKFETLQRKGLEEEELLQGKFETVQRVANNSGLPDHLKSGIESMSGVPMDDVRVHFNSGEPATLQAHAFTKGTNIHVAPGQEKHLAHEAWHVVQQKQGRVQPTMRLNGQSINDSPSLEQEADVMGAKALNVAPAQFMKKRL